MSLQNVEQQQLINHRNEAPKERPENTSEVSCDICGWMFDNSSFLQLHKVLMHSRQRQLKSMSLP